MWRVDIGNDIDRSRIMSAAGAELVDLDGSVGSVWEYAYSFTPSTGGSATFIGNGHGYDTATRWQRRPAELVRYSTLGHPDTAAEVGNVVTRYRFDRHGMHVDHSTRWALAGTVDPGYLAMMPAADALDLGELSDPTTLPQRLNSDDGLYRLTGIADAARLSSGDYAAVISTSSPDIMRVQDRAGGDINKVYRPQLDTAVAPGDIWAHSATYTVQLR